MRDPKCCGMCKESDAYLFLITIYTSFQQNIICAKVCVHNNFASKLDVKLQKHIKYEFSSYLEGCKFRIHVQPIFIVSHILWQFHRINFSISTMYSCILINYILNFIVFYICSSFFLQDLNKS